MRRYQFSIRVAFLAVVACACICAYLRLYVARIESQRVALSLLREKEGLALRYDGSIVLPPDSPTTWLQAITGSRKIESVYSISFNNPFGQENTQLKDSDLSVLERVGTLEMLVLSRTALTDTGLQHVGKVPSLRILQLEGTKITDVGIKNIVALKQLRELNVGLTRLGDPGMESIGQLDNLEVLSLESTAITDGSMHMLENLSALKDLNLWGVPVSDKGSESLCKIRSLTKLAVGGTRLTDNGFLALVRDLANLESLEMRSTSVTPVCVETIIRERPTISMLWDGNVEIPEHLKPYSKSPL